MSQYPEQLRCRIIIHPEGGETRLPFPQADVEILNCSSEPIAIEYQGDVFQHLDLIIKTENSVTVSRFRYGLMFLQYGSSIQTLLLQPTQTYRCNVSLFATVGHENIRAGEYTAQALFDYRDMVVISEAIGFHISGF